MLTVWIAQAGYDHIAARAKAAGVDVSTMHRRMLSFAAQHMSPEWLPPSKD